MADRDPAELAKWHFLERAPVQDAADPRVVRCAYHLWQAAGGSVRVFVLLCAARAREGIRFQTDTARVGGEDLGTPGDALDRGVDDCDAKARTFCALCLARGVPARMMPRWTGPLLGHVYAAVLLDGEWQPVELTLARARVGDEPTSVPKETTGQWLRT